MTTPKSANERLRRKLRMKKKTKREKDMPGRIVVKKSADNDPNRIKKVSEDFVKLYKGEKIENPRRFSGLIDDLIDISIELGGKNTSFPVRLNRLQELKEEIDVSELPDEDSWVDN